MSVWHGLVGQRPTSEVLAQAARGQGMTHAWLFTGPPGSGRSNAAIAFAAALRVVPARAEGSAEARTVTAELTKSAKKNAAERSN